MQTHPASILDQSSASGKGLASFLKYVDYAKETLEWAVTENVERFLQQRRQFGNERPIAIQSQAMAERGFVFAAVLGKAQHFGVPQSRSRAWALYLKARCMKAAHPSPKLSMTFYSMQRSSFPLEDVLVDKTPKSVSSMENARCFKKDATPKKWHKQLTQAKRELSSAMMQLHFKKLTALTAELDLTHRETWLVTAAVCRLVLEDLDPYANYYVLQYDQNLVASAR